MSHPPEHISVCVCTYKRATMLTALLQHLRGQQTGGLFSYSILVVDNDSAQSARGIVESFVARSPVGVEYICEPEQNIAVARNRAVQAARGTFVALIDDDEFPASNWLLALYGTCVEHSADGVLGPVKPRFEHAPPRWVVRGRFYEKGQHQTGAVLRWQDTRTSNALLKRSLFDDPANRFDPAFSRGGEDVDFFTRMIAKGFVFVWCKEAAVFETIPPERCRRMFMIKRALLRGKVSLQYSTFGFGYILKSLIAVPAYSLILPVSAVSGSHHFMNVAIRLFEHLGRLLALGGIDPIRQRYVMK